MKKFIPTRFARKGFLLISAIFGLLTFPSFAQTTSPAPAKNIGPAPFNSKQHQILDSALSTETRETLQEAMNSVGTTGSAKSK